MADVWSFNTTVRNPERMEALLRILSDMEGVVFDAAGQEKFFGLQIKKRFYTPMRRTLGDELAAEIYDSDLTEELSDETVSRILEKYRGSVDSAGRGRTSVAVLNRFGLSIALQSHGPIAITPLGKKWLNGEIDDEELFTRFLLRWQYPNPIEAGYSAFDVKPFVAVIHLIIAVNKRWNQLGNKPVGLSKDEYRLFALSIKSQSDIDIAVSHIISLRLKSRSLSGKERADHLRNFTRQRVISIFGYTNENNLRKQTSNLKDYADSSLRYFRISGLVSLRGSGRYIDISRDKTSEADSILNAIQLPSMDFNLAENYLEYLGDLSYELPWQNEADLANISRTLISVLKKEADEVSAVVDVSETAGKPLSRQVRILQDKLNDVRILKLRSLRHNLDVLDESVQKLSAITSPRYEPITARPSLDFEWYASRALMVLNDALRIEPSYKVGDDGLPTGFRAGLSDIECEYLSFGLTMEVTLLTGRDQWHAEGQSVMRHLRDFEDKLPEQKSTYCLFVAPFIHRDTLNTFWVSNKYEFEGKRQRIIPLSLSEFVDFLRVARDKIENGSLDHSSIQHILETIDMTVDDHSDSVQWRHSIKDLITAW